MNELSSDKPCIFCKEKGKKGSIEHIIPEALGCPENLVLKNGEVCEDCNNGLGHLDDALINAFDLIRFQAKVPGKKGKLPTIISRGNFIAEYVDGEPKIYINPTNKPVKLKDGRVIGPSGKSKRNIDLKISIDGKMANVNMGFKIGEDPKAVRALFKIAYEYICFQFGESEVLQEKYDNIRSYIVTGSPKRKVVAITPDSSSYENRIWAPYISEEGYYSVALRIAVLEFMVDLSPEMTLFERFKKELEKSAEFEWNYFPSDNP
jgi:hypothetical protein